MNNFSFNLNTDMIDFHWNQYNEDFVKNIKKVIPDMSVDLIHAAF